MRNNDMYINRNEHISNRRAQEFWHTAWASAAGIQIALALVAGVGMVPFNGLVAILVIQLIGCVVMAYEYVAYERRVPDFLWMFCACSITVKAIIEICWPGLYRAADLLQMIAALSLISRTIIRQAHRS